MNPNRPTQVMHRARGLPTGRYGDLERAMNRIAELTKKTRDETFIEKLPNGKLVNMTPAIFALGGATLEVEFNHLCQLCAGSASWRLKIRRGYDTALASPVWGHDSPRRSHPLPRSMADSDCIVVMGSNMAENHPVAFRWPMKAKVGHGAKIIHVDPRFTRTSAVADIYAPVRAGSDIAFLGGVINYVLNSETWNQDPFFKTFVVHYTNAATIINEDFKDTEELDGVFSGLTSPRAGSTNGRSTALSTSTTAQPGNTREPRPGSRAGLPRPRSRVRPSCPRSRGHQVARDIRRAAEKAPVGPPFDALVASLVKPPAQRDETLQDPRCVLQIVKTHFARYTPEIVEKTTGCPKETFLKVAETILANSGADKTTSFAYAVAWTQHTYGVQIIGACALLQLLLGNIGRPGAGVMALRGHASIRARRTCRRSTTRSRATWRRPRRSRRTTRCRIPRG